MPTFCENDFYRVHQGQVNNILTVATSLNNLTLVEIIELALFLILLCSGYLAALRSNQKSEYLSIYIRTMMIMMEYKMLQCDFHKLQ